MVNVEADGFAHRNEVFDFLGALGGLGNAQGTRLHVNFHALSCRRRDDAGALGGGNNRFPDYLMREDGTWKVGDASLCGLFRLIPGGTVPTACNSAG